MAYFDLNPLLAKMLDVAPGISDLNLSVGKPPQVEVEGKLNGVSYSGIERLSPYNLKVLTGAKHPPMKCVLRFLISVSKLLI